MNGARKLLIRRFLTVLLAFSLTLWGEADAMVFHFNTGPNTGPASIHGVPVTFGGTIGNVDQWLVHGDLNLAPAIP